MPKTNERHFPMLGRKPVEQVNYRVTIDRYRPPQPFVDYGAAVSYLRNNHKNPKGLPFEELVKQNIKPIKVKKRTDREIFGDVEE